MSIWNRSAKPTPERRNSGELSLQQAMSLMAGNRQSLDMGRMEQSLQVIAVRSAVDLLASIASELPLIGWRGTEADRTKLTLPGYLDDPAGDGQGVQDWIYQLVTSWLLRGNMYGDVLEYGPGGTLRQVLIYHPDHVHAAINEREGTVKWSVNNRDVVDQSTFLHRRVNPVPGCLLGLSPIAAHADSIGQNIQATRFGTDWFRDGAHPSGILSNSETDMAGRTQAQTAKDRFLAAFFGGSREPLVLGKGWKWEQIQVNANESQFLETMGYTAAEAARIFGAGVPEVLGYKSGGSMTYANVIDRDLTLLKYSVNRWLKRVERLLSQFLPRPQYVEFDREAFLETNAMQQWAMYAIALKSQAMTPNEVRAKMKMPPVAWGNEPVQTAAPAAPAGDDTDPQADPNAGEEEE